MAIISSDSIITETLHYLLAQLLIKAIRVKRERIFKSPSPLHYRKSILLLLSESRHFWCASSQWRVEIKVSALVCADHHRYARTHINRQVSYEFNKFHLFKI